MNPITFSHSSSIMSSQNCHHCQIDIPSAPNQSSKNPNNIYTHWQGGEKYIITFNLANENNIFWYDGEKYIYDSLCPSCHKLCVCNDIKKTCTQTCKLCKKDFEGFMEFYVRPSQCPIHNNIRITCAHVHNDIRVACARFPHRLCILCAMD
jgi:hypothetical protein